jgi:hypothetical protein
MIDNLEKLRDAFLMHKVSQNTMRNPLACEAWEKALADPSKVRIWSYYVLSGLEDWGLDIMWSEIE